MAINADALEKWRLQREMKRLYDGKYRAAINESTTDNSEQFDNLCRQYDQASASLRARLREIESTKLIEKASRYQIVIADLAPLRFGSPLWQNEAGCQYLSAEGMQAVQRAISNARTERVKFWLTFIAPLTGLIGAIAAVIALRLR